MNLDRALMAECKAIEKLKSGEEKDVLDWALKLKGDYLECAKNHGALVKALGEVK